MLLPLANDHTYTGCAGPSEEAIELTFGGDVHALTSAYRAQIDRVGELLGCCSPGVCAEYGLGNRSCSLAELPSSFTGKYWSYYEGPLQLAGYYSHSFMLQAVSGVEPVAWGEVSRSELDWLYEAHERVMWLGASLDSARAFASHGLAYLVATLEDIKTTSSGAAASRGGQGGGGGGGGAPPPPPLPGLVLEGASADGRRPKVLAVFGHDFNLLYLRKLLRLHWVTDSYNFDTAITGSSLSLELHRSIHSPNGGTTSSSSSSAAAGTSPPITTSWRVIGRLTAASIEQQRNATPLVPPYAPPSVATVLDMAYDDFRALALEAIDTRCVLEPLRATVVEMQKAQGRRDRLSRTGSEGPHPGNAEGDTPTAMPDDGDGSSGANDSMVPTAAAVGISACLLIVGCVGGLLLHMLLRTCLQKPRAVPTKHTLEMTSVEAAGVGGGGGATPDVAPV